MVLRGEAAQARSDFRHALGAYLDVLVLLLAAQEGPEGAMDQAAQAGQGPAFARVAPGGVGGPLDGRAGVGRRSTSWAVGCGFAELREIAAAGSLAGESGAAVRKSLMAKARAMRQRALAEMEAEARRNSQAMFAPAGVDGPRLHLVLDLSVVHQLVLRRLIVTAQPLTPPRQQGSKQ